MAELPLHPMMSKTILASEKYKCLEEVISIIAMLSVQTALFSNVNDKKGSGSDRNVFSCHEGDHLLLLDIWERVLN